MSYGNLIQAIMGLGGFETSDGTSPLLELIKQHSENSDAPLIRASSHFGAALIAKMICKQKSTGKILTYKELSQTCRELGFKLGRTNEDRKNLTDIQEKINQRYARQFGPKDNLTNHSMIRVYDRIALFRQKIQQLIPRGKILRKKALGVTKREITIKKNGKKITYLCYIKNGTVYADVKT